MTELPCPCWGLGVFKATEGGEVDPFEPVD
jgi:hypothetical protein